MVEANPEQQDFIIRKAPMIRKNEQPLESVYRRDPKQLGKGTYGVVSAATHIETG